MTTAATLIPTGQTVRWILRGQHWKTGRRWEQVHEGEVVAFVPAWTNVEPLMPDGVWAAYKWPFANRSGVGRYLVLCGKGTYYRAPLASVLEKQNPRAVAT